MASDESLIHIVIESPGSEEYSVKAAFESKEKAREAIEQEFPEAYDYEIVSRTLYKNISS